MLNHKKDLNIITLGAAQLNFTVGDTNGNLALMLKTIEEAQAQAQGLHMVVFPELAQSGYPPPEDLLYRPAYLAQINTALDLNGGFAGNRCDRGPSAANFVWVTVTSSPN